MYFDIPDAGRYSSDVLSGNSRNGIAVASEKIDEFTENGIYEIRIYIADNAGNGEQYSKYTYDYDYSSGPVSGGGVSGGPAIQLNSEWDSILAEFGITNDSVVINKPVEFFPGEATIDGINLGSTVFGYAIQNGPDGPVFQVQYAGGCL